MVGHQIKYEPAWIPSKSKTRDTLKTANANESLRPVTAGLNSESLEKVKKSLTDQRANSLRSTTHQSVID